jgi:hypothetical protein
VGSGLILLLIVGAWLAVLVPMALRSHDSATSMKSTDTFSDAMRVLSRRGSRDVLVPKRKHSTLVVSETKSPRAPRIPEEALVEEEPVEPRPPKTAAERRLRVLVVLVGTALVTLGLGLYGFRALLAAHALCDVMLVAFVVHLRRQAVLKAQGTARAARRGARPPQAARPARPVRRAPRIAGIPDRMPPKPAPLTMPLPAPAARYEDRPVLPAAATGTDGSWSPVPVPPPTYVGKAIAPKRQPRVLDLTQPGAWTATLEGEDLGLDLLGDDAELDDILERRRAVNGW